MSRWRPSPDEERWLAVASELGAAVAPAVFAERSGGWRSTGPLARIALFVLGLVASALLLAIIGVGDSSSLLVAGLAAVLAAEWLTVHTRLYASGIEEGLSVSGFFLVGAWITTVMYPEPGFAGAAVEPLLIAVVGLAGLRRLNAFVTTCAVVGLVYWVGSTATAHGLDRSIGGGMTAMLFGCALAAVALALGAWEYRRPSHDRMLDWLVATLPVVAWAHHASWSAYDASHLVGGAGTVRLVTAVLLVALGAALLAAGLRRRRHAPLLGFMGCVACLAVELRLPTTLATETWLLVYGLAALVAGVALDRFLRQPRDGVTSSSLTDREGPLDLLQTAGAAVLAQRAAPEAPSEPGYTPGGGKFGGGGASGGY